MPGIARLGTDAAADRAPSTPIARAATPRRLMEPVAAWYVGNVLLGTPPPENARRRPHRLQDRHQLRLSRCLVGRLRRQAHDRRLGRPARRRAGAGPGRPRARRRRSCSTPSRARGKLPAPLPRAAQGRRSSPPTAKLPPPLQRFPPGRPGRALARSRRCASCSRPTARGSSWRASGGKPDPVALKVAGGVAPLTVLVNGVPVPAQTGTAHAVLRAGRPRLRARSP